MLSKQCAFPVLFIFYVSVCALLGPEATMHVSSGSARCVHVRCASQRCCHRSRCVSGGVWFAGGCWVTLTWQFLGNVRLFLNLTQCEPMLRRPAFTLQDMLRYIFHAGKHAFICSYVYKKHESKIFNFNGEETKIFPFYVLFENIWVVCICCETNIT